MPQELHLQYDEVGSMPPSRPSGLDPVGRLCLLPQGPTGFSPRALNSPMTEKHEQQRNYSSPGLRSDEGDSFGFQLPISPLEDLWKRHWC